MGTPVLYWYKYIEIRLLRLEPLITVRIYILMIWNQSDISSMKLLYIGLIQFFAAISVRDSAHHYRSISIISLHNDLVVSDTRLLAIDKYVYIDDI